MSTAWEGSFILAGSGGSDPVTNAELEEHSRHDDRLPHAGLNLSNVTPSVRAGDVLGLNAACARGEARTPTVGAEGRRQQAGSAPKRHGSAALACIALATAQPAQRRSTAQALPARAAADGTAVPRPRTASGQDRTTRLCGDMHDGQHGLAGADSMGAIQSARLSHKGT